MFFNSLLFAAFLILCLTLYYALQWAGRHRLQNRLLLLASYIFYAAWDWRFCFLIALSTVVDFQVGRALGRTSEARHRRRLVMTSVAVNIGLLGYFKYANFFADSFQALFAGLGIELGSLTLDVILPVGISFYTFQTLSYTFEVARRRVDPVDDFFDFALYVAYFPQLVAGPIERATSFLPQILNPREVTWDRFSSGGWLIFWGIFKKVVIADNLAKIVDIVFSGASEPTSAEMLMAIYAFTFQIYCDFSGYTDIARGAGRMMGFDLTLNFRLPFFAVNPSDYWKRWHISLSSWFSDYVFVPLSFSRFMRKRFSVDNAIYASLMITWTLVGLWHGAAWTFVLWGIFHGAALIAHRRSSRHLRHVVPKTDAGRMAWHAARMVGMFHLNGLGMILFRSSTLSEAMSNLAVLLGPPEIGFAASWILPFAVLIAPLMLIQIAQARSDDLEVVLRWPLGARVALYLILAFMIVTLGEDGGQPFIYFQF